MARLLSILAVAFAVLGCQRNSQSSNPGELAELKKAVSALDEKIEKLTKSVESLQQTASTKPATAGTTNSNDSATHALAAAREKLEAKQYVSAYDLLLAAIRLDPSSPEIFDATLEFIRRAAESKDDQALDLANDLYVRAAGLIPFQPVSDIASAREKYVDAGQVFEPSTPTAPANPLESIRTEITTLKKADMSSEIRSLIAQRIRSDLESVAVRIVSDGLASEAGFLEQWNDVKTQLEHVETEILTKLYTDVRERVTKWKNESAAILQRYEKAKTQELSSIGDAIVAAVQTGYRLRSEMVPFVESAIVGAKDDQQELDKRLDHLERTKEWIHNQHALATISYVRENKQLTPLEKLIRLAKYDERRFSPYVLQRYQEEWNHWFEELDDEQQKVEATKSRILGEVIP